MKIIDAKQSLSIQVHPDDEFALREENEYGKNEMWHIMDCEPGSFIYYGVNRSLTKEELRRRVENNTVLEVLNKIEVHKGDTFLSMRERFMPLARAFYCAKFSRIPIAPIGFMIMTVGINMEIQESCIWKRLRRFQI